MPHVTDRADVSSDTIDWLLDSDPAIRWQVMADLMPEPDDVVEAERSRVATEGWGARLLALQDDDGQWAGGAHFPAEFDWSTMTRGDDGRLRGQPWTATSWSLTLLRLFGLDPESTQARSAVAGVAEGCRWEHAGQRFFDGEVEPCINGLTVANATYFGVDVTAIVERLLGEQMVDGGWNCEQENGSTRGSFHTTIAVLEGLSEYQKASATATEVRAAQRRGEEYLLERHLCRRLSDGAVIDQHFLELSFPNWWYYDVLRALDYFRKAGRAFDSRADEAVRLVREKRDADGRWVRESVHHGDVHFEIDAAEGEPSRWITLRAQRVLDWAT